MSSHTDVLDAIESELIRIGQSMQFKRKPARTDSVWLLRTMTEMVSSQRRAIETASEEGSSHGHA
ncbi:MAG: hypothetical protein OEY97_07835 [Nitrospirota bacterium]|nr:hypothetical protein [Nitrospirota bacterium]